MKPADFDFIADLVKKHSGFSLLPSQIYLLENRLSPILRQNNLIGLEDLVTSLKLNNVELRNSVIEAVGVNNTRFFRNQYVFDSIQDFVHEKLTSNPNCSQVRILSAGCASGQEPVSIALLLEEMDLPEKIQKDIYALDLSRLMIKRAKNGQYTHYEVQKGLPIKMLLKYFDQVEKDTWKLKSNVSQMIHFQVHNLMDSFEEKDFDIVLCRNMLGYMTSEAQDKALKNIASIMHPEGVLILGASEVLPENMYFQRIPGQLACYSLNKESVSSLSKNKFNMKNFIKKPRFKSALSSSD